MVESTAELFRLQFTDWVAEKMQKSQKAMDKMICAEDVGDEPEIEFGYETGVIKYTSKNKKLKITIQVAEEEV